MRALGKGPQTLSSTVTDPWTRWSPSMPSGACSSLVLGSDLVGPNIGIRVPDHIGVGSPNIFIGPPPHHWVVSLEILPDRSAAFTSFNPWLSKTRRL